MGQTGVREAHEIVDAAAGAAVATADQPVAAHAPGLARSAANLPRAFSAFRDTAQSRRCETELALIAFVAAAHT